MVGYGQHELCRRIADQGNSSCPSVEFFMCLALSVTLPSLPSSQLRSFIACWTSLLKHIKKTKAKQFSGYLPSSLQNIFNYKIYLTTKYLYFNSNKVSQKCLRYNLYTLIFTLALRLLLQISLISENDNTSLSRLLEPNTQKTFLIPHFLSTFNPSESTGKPSSKCISNSPTSLLCQPHFKLYHLTSYRLYCKSFLNALSAFIQFYAPVHFIHRPAPKVISSNTN